MPSRDRYVPKDDGLRALTEPRLAAGPATIPSDDSSQTWNRRGCTASLRRFSRDGGYVLTQDRLDTYVPIGNAAMDDRTFIEWDKDDVDALHAFSGTGYLPYWDAR